MSCEGRDSERDCGYGLAGEHDAESESHCSYRQLNRVVNGLTDGLTDTSVQSLSG